MIDTRKEDTQGYQIIAWYFKDAISVVLSLAWNFRVALCVACDEPLSPIGPLRLFRFIEE